MNSSSMATAGGSFNFADPSNLSEVRIEDIAFSLGRQLRYLGHTRFDLSVAMHCVVMSYMVPEENALEALLHDASEALMGDLPSPLKRYLPDYKALEDTILEAILRKYGNGPYSSDKLLSPIVKIKDVELGRHERHMTGHGPLEDRQFSEEAEKAYQIIEDSFDALYIASPWEIYMERYAELANYKRDEVYEHKAWYGDLVESINAPVEVAE